MGGTLGAMMLGGGLMGAGAGFASSALFQASPLAGLEGGAMGALAGVAGGAAGGYVGGLARAGIAAQVAGQSLSAGRQVMIASQIMAMEGLVGGGVGCGVQGFGSAILAGQPFGAALSAGWRGALQGAALGGAVGVAMPWAAYGIKGATASVRGLLSGRPAGQRDLWVHLTEEQYRAISRSGVLGKGYQGIGKIALPPFDEGRIWATTYSPGQMRGTAGALRKMAIGMSPWKATPYSIRITQDAATAFGKAFGPGFSLNPVGWLKGLTPQWQFRGQLAYGGGGVITSMAGATHYSAGQMAAYRAGELWRLAVYSGLGYGVYEMAR